MIDSSNSEFIGRMAKIAIIIGVNMAVGFGSCNYKPSPFMTRSALFGGIFKHPIHMAILAV